MLTTIEQKVRPFDLFLDYSVTGAMGISFLLRSWANWRLSIFYFANILYGKLSLFSWPKVMYIEKLDDLYANILWHPTLP